MATSAPRRAARVQGGPDRRLLFALTLVALLPLVVGVARVVVEGTPALNSDDALIELKVRDVGGADTPLIGSYGRFGWNHPGPLLFYVLAVPYRLLGSEFAGMQVGALLLGAAAVVGIVLVAARRGGVVLALWTLLLSALLAWGLGPGPLSDPWEPHVTVLPLALLLLLAFDTAAGRAWSLPVAVGLGSLLAAAQATLLPIVAALVGWSVVALIGTSVLRARRVEPGGGRRLAAALAVSAAVAAVLWTPPVIEELRHDPGNLRAMWEFQRGSRETLGVADGWSAISLQLDHRAPWLVHDVPLIPLTTTVDLEAAPAVPVALLALAVGIGLAAWRRDRVVLLGVTAFVGLAAGLAGMSQLVGDLYPWLLQWTRTLGFGCWLATGWCIYRALGDRVRGRLDRALVPLLAVGVVVVSAVAVVGAATHDEDSGLRDALVELGEAGAADLRDVRGPVLVRSEARTGALVFSEGIGAEQLALVLEREGLDVVVDEELENRFGEHRARPGRAVAELKLVTGRPRGADLRGFRRVATADPMGSRERERRARTIERIERRFGRADGSLEDLRRAMDEDPGLRRLVGELGTDPDLPELSVLVRRP